MRRPEVQRFPDLGRSRSFGRIKDHPGRAQDSGNKDRPANDLHAEAIRLAHFGLTIVRKWQAGTSRAALRHPTRASRVEAAASEQGVRFKEYSQGRWFPAIIGVDVARSYDYWRPVRARYNAAYSSPGFSSVSGFKTMSGERAKTMIVARMNAGMIMM